MGRYKGQDTNGKVDIITDALWAFDRIKTKHLMAFRLEYVPTTEFILGMLDTYLKVECHNDAYVFPEGTRSAGRTRTKEIHKELREKIGRVRELLDRWEAVADEDEQ